MKRFFYKKFTLLLFDLGMIFFSYLISLWAIILTGEENQVLRYYWASAVIFTLCNLVFLWILRVYESFWRYNPKEEMLRCLSACLLGTLSFICAGVFAFDDLQFVLKLSALSFLFSVVGIGLARSIYRTIRLYQTPADFEENKVLIVGAGEATSILIYDMEKSNSLDYQVVGLVDDDKKKQGKQIRGIPILGTTEDIPSLCEKHNVAEIIVAIPSLSVQDKNRILGICSKTDCEVKIIPSIYQLITSDEPMLSQIRKINIEDLLERKPVVFEDDDISYIKDSVVLVTGGGGSIGSELCKQIFLAKPKKLIVLDIYENNAYDLQQELVRKHKDISNVKIEIASIRDHKKLDELFGKYKPDLVFHAAAHKHVPLMEDNPVEAVKNNIGGTFSVAELSAKYQVKKFVLISTDKAVNPTNVMGATKRCCEMVVQYFSRHAEETEFVAVRFGNVLGSNGSVIPMFKKQVENGGPLTVTHPDIVRYFMTIPEAASLVLQAGAMAKGGEIFVLDMGEPVKILTLAENIIKLLGYVPYKDIKIEFTGLRPGEKLYEELFMESEELAKTGKDRILCGKPIEFDDQWFLQQLEFLRKTASENNSCRTRTQLAVIVDTYQPCQTVDYDNNDIEHLVSEEGKSH